MRALLLLALVPLTACGVTVRASCEVTSTDLEDAEVSALGFSADELIAEVAGDYDVGGTYEDSSSVNVEVGVHRAAGPARLLRSEPVSIRTPNGDLFGESTLLMAVVCFDSVSVPVTLRVETADGTIRFEEAAEARADEENLLAVVQVDSEVLPVEADGLPPADKEGVESAFATTSFRTGTGSDMPAEIALSGTLGWQGESTRRFDGGSIVSTWAEYLLDW